MVWHSSGSAAYLLLLVMLISRSGTQSIQSPQQYETDLRSLEFASTQFVYCVLYKCHFCGLV